jgi:hypothetical protein
VYGDDNEQDYGMRIYDPRLGRFLSVDPIARQYPELTPYQFASNTPIWGVDLDGLEVMGYSEVFKDAKYGKLKPVFDNNTVWQTYMRDTWASATKGETFDAKNDGLYADIPLKFTGLRDKESSVMAVSAISIDKNGKRVTLDEYSEKNLDGKSLYVSVIINLDYIGSPTNALLTIPHEVILHAQKQAALIKDYRGGMVTLDDFKSQYALMLQEQSGHAEIVNKGNTSYEAVNDATQSIINRYFPYKITRVGTGIDCCGIIESGVPMGQDIGNTASGKKPREISIPYSMEFEHQRNRERNSYDPEKKACQCNETKMPKKE